MAPARIPAKGYTPQLKSVGWLALSMQKQRLNKRRFMKTELHILSNIDETALNKDMLKTAQTAIEKSLHQKYSPRALPKLFEPKSKT